MLRRTFLKTTAAAAALTGVRRPVFGAADGSANPVTMAWTGPYGGVPPFDRIEVPHFKPGVLQAMHMARADLKRIFENKVAPTFGNTLAAYQDAGRAYDRAERLYSIFTATMNDDRMSEVETELEPAIAAFDDEIVQNEALFERIKSVYDARESAGLDAEQQRLMDVVYRYFARRGAGLGKAYKARLAEINKQLASLYTSFRQNQLADEESYILTLDSESDLEGLPESLRASAAASADAKGMSGKWVITNTRSSMEPFITYSARRDLREKGWRMWIMRGDNGDTRDNKSNISKILQLRAERAKLLGFPTHAHWVTDDGMAGTPDAAMNLMMKVWPAAVTRVREEVADMQAIADGEGAGLKIEPWDYRHYAEKVRKAKYDLDQNEVKSYLQLDKLREGMFWAAGQVYGLEFVPVTGVPVYHPDMVVYEVRRGGAHVGLWYFDPYARDGKRSGAWMNSYRTQERFQHEVTPIVSNNSNFVKGAPGEPVLVSWDDARTMFHEFGHALHGLLSNVRYPGLAGTAVKRDFVEFPSQINEHWLSTPEVLNRFALHYKMGKPIPAELVAKLEKARTFNQGFSTVEYLASAIYDLKVHLAPAEPAIDAGAFEKQCLTEIGCPGEIVMRHRPTQFGHIFAGDGYSAGYFNYIWADTLTADAIEAFKEAPGGLYDKDVAKRLYDTIMSVGNSIPPDEAFRRFRGRDVDTDALMRDRGFPVSKV